MVGIKVWCLVWEWHGVSACRSSGPCTSGGLEAGVAPDPDGGSGE